MKTTFLIVSLVSTLAVEPLFAADPTVPLNFSGTSGQTNAPVSLTLSQPVQFLITGSVSSGNFMLFTIRNAQATSQTQSSFATNAFSSSIFYSINGTGSYAVSGWADGGYNSGNVTNTDSYFWMVLAQSLSPGDVVVFNSGTLQGTPTMTNFDVPLSGDYTTFLADASFGSDGIKISEYGTVVPEPSTYALLLLGGAASLWALKRRKS